LEDKLNSVSLELVSVRNETRLQLADASNRELVLTKKLDSSIEEFNRERDTLVNNIERQTAASMSSEAKIVSLEDKLNSVSLDLTTAQRHNKALVSENEILRVDINNIRTSCSNKMQMSQSREQKLEQELEASKSKLEEELNLMRECKLKFKANTIELNASLQSADERCRTISDEVNKLQTMRRREKEDSAAALTLAQSKISELSSQLEVSKNAFAMKTEEVNSIHGKVSTLQHLLDNKARSDKMLLDVQSKLNQAEADAISSQDKMLLLEETAASYRSRLQSREAAILTLEEACRDLKSQLSDMIHQQGTVDKQSANLKSERDALLLQNEGISKTLRNVEIQLQDAVVARDDALASFRRTTSELTLKNEENLSLSSSSTSSRESLALCEKKYVELSQVNNELKNHVNSLMRKAEIIPALESKNEVDATTIMKLKSESDSLHADLDKIEALHGESMNEIESLKADNMMLTLRNNEYTERSSAYQKHLSEVNDQMTKSKAQFEKKIKAMEMTLDLQTSDLRTALGVVSYSVHCLSEAKKCPQSMVQRGDDSVVESYCQVSDIDDERGNNMSCDASSLSRYCDMLKDIVNRLSTSYSTSYSESFPLLKTSSIKSWAEIEAVVNRIGQSNATRCIERFCDCFVDPTECPDDELLNLHNSRLSEIGVFVSRRVNDVLIRNTVIELLCMDVVCLKDELDALGHDTAILRQSLYNNERKLSKCKRERNRVEEVLREKMPSEEYFNLMKLSEIEDLEQLPDFEEKKSEIYMQGGGFHPQKGDHCPLKLKAEGSFGEEQYHDEDCASSISWCSKDDLANLSNLQDETRSVKSGRGARISSTLLRKKGGTEFCHFPEDDFFTKDALDCSSIAAS